MRARATLRRVWAAAVSVVCAAAAVLAVAQTVAALADDDAPNKVAGLVAIVVVFCAMVVAAAAVTVWGSWRRELRYAGAGLTSTSVGGLTCVVIALAGWALFGTALYST